MYMSLNLYGLCFMTKNNTGIILLLANLKLLVNEIQFFPSHMKILNILAKLPWQATFLEFYVSHMLISIYFPGPLELI